jgi:hypothetical protein
VEDLKFLSSPCCLLKLEERTLEDEKQSRGPAALRRCGEGVNGGRETEKFTDVTKIRTPELKQCEAT